MVDLSGLGVGWRCARVRLGLDIEFATAAAGLNGWYVDNLKVTAC